mmetsp:Transcript_7445/g.6711  ORF Transcript_7445/g.6711 Transcript_7445/m.6711 type:complete len:100 (+) Transcript_7445:23-322(+)
MESKVQPNQTSPQNLGLGPISNVQDKIELADDLLLQNEQFKKNVAIPYFKDIYKDLSERSDKKAKGINRVVFLEYVNLPGIISERFFKIVDENNDEYID